MSPALLLPVLLALVARQEPLSAAPATVQAPASTWRVVTKSSPPFAFRGPEGSWRGVAIELAEEIAAGLDVRLELSEVETVDALLEAVEAGHADSAVAAISVTPQREAHVDFSHPYYVAGLGVAVRASREGSGLTTLVRALTSRAFLQLVGLVLVILVAGGFLFWLAERKRHPQFREGGTKAAFGTGIWWSTIILFGHKGIFPKSLFGALLAATGMLASILMLSVLTGAIASVLTVQRLEAPIQGVDDLRQLRTAAVAGTSGAQFLELRRVLFRPVPTPRDGLRLLDEQKIDALVHDAPLLQYLQRTAFPEVQVLERTFDVRDYAIAFALESPWRKPVNRVLLEVRGSEEWAEMLYRYLGR